MIVRWIRQIFVFLTYLLLCLQHAHADVHAHAADVLFSEIYLGSREGDPVSLIENVSTIHEDYTEVKVDVTVAAPDTLILSRFYSSRDPLSIATCGGWRFNPHCFLNMQKDPKGKYL